MACSLKLHKEVYMRAFIVIYERAPVASAEMFLGKGIAVAV